MADIIDFTKRRLGQQKEAVTLASLEANSTQSLLSDWEKMARNNRLNEFFKASLASVIDPASRANFMVDLNEIAHLELNLQVFPIVYHPGTMSDKQHGWVVMFDLGEHRATTPELASEAYARCFGLLLHSRLKRAALEAKLIS